MGVALAALGFLNPLGVRKESLIVRLSPDDGDEALKVDIRLGRWLYS
jgi:hypothetical protein